MAAAGSIIVFAKNKADHRLNDLTGATLKLALVGSAWTPDASVTGNYLWADISAQRLVATCSAARP